MAKVLHRKELEYNEVVEKTTILNGYVKSYSKVSIAVINALCDDIKFTSNAFANKRNKKVEETKGETV